MKAVSTISSPWTSSNRGRTLYAKSLGISFTWVCCVAVLRTGRCYIHGYGSKPSRPATITSLVRTDWLPRNLRPDGWVEQVEFDWTPRSDDGSVTPRHVVSQAVNALYTAMDLAARDMRINSSEIRKQYENAGFTDIREEVYRIPFNMWDSSLTEVGHWMNAAFYAAFEGQLMAPLTRLLQIPKDQTLRMAAQAVGEVQTKRNHGYFLLSVSSQPTRASAN